MPLIDDDIGDGVDATLSLANEPWNVGRQIDNRRRFGRNEPTIDDRIEKWQATRYLVGIAKGDVFGRWNRRRDDGVFEPFDEHPRHGMIGHAYADCRRLAHHHAVLREPLAR